MPRMEIRQEEIREERDRISAALFGESITRSQREKLYAAQQALSWVDDPLMARSPFDVVMLGPVTTISPSWGTLPD
jgi:hypothetical protein